MSKISSCDHAAVGVNAAPSCHFIEVLFTDPSKRCLNNVESPSVLSSLYNLVVRCVVVGDLLGLSEGDMDGCNVIPSSTFANDPQDKL